MRGARDTGIAVEGITRGAFLARAALTAGAAYGASAVGPFVARSFEQGGDVAIRNFALTLENIEADFYKAALGAERLSEENRRLFEQIGRNEAEHAETLTQTINLLGAKPAPKPRTRFDIGDEQSVLRIAVRLEDTGVSAYNGAAPAIRSKDILQAAGSIAAIEARHAAAVRVRAGEDAAPRAFDEPLGTDEVLRAVRPFVPE